MTTKEPENHGRLFQKEWDMAAIFTKEKTIPLAKLQKIRAVFDAFAAEVEGKTKKAFGGCEKCYGKGYSTQSFSGRSTVNTCVCERGKQIDRILAEADKALISWGQKLVPDFVLGKYKRKGEQGDALLAARGILDYMRNNL